MKSHRTISVSHKGRWLIPGIIIAGWLSAPGDASAETSRHHVWEITFPLEKNSGTYADGWHLCRPSASDCTRAHRAVDIYATPGTPVYAAFDGVIRWRRTSSASDWSPTSGSGYALYIDAPGDVFRHFYGHFGPDEPGREAEAFAVNPSTGSLWEVGDTVLRGQLLGFVGTSGATASGAHLHFELRSLKANLPIDDPGDDAVDGRNYGDPSATIGSFGYLRYDPFPSLVAAEERNDYPSGVSTLTIDDFVEVVGVNNALNVRGPDACDPALPDAGRPPGTVGRIVGGPAWCPSITSSRMWRVQWSDCVLGWSSEAFLEKTARPDNPCSEEIPGVIIDDEHSGFEASSNWAVATWADDAFGPNFRYRQVADVADFASWTADIPYAGNYQLYAWWSSWADGATAASYLITHADGTATIPRNQAEKGGRWNLIGSYRFEKGPALIRLSPASPGGNVVVADAVRLVALDGPPPLAEYALVTGISGSGSIERTPDLVTYTDGDQVQLNATPAEEFEFIQWSGSFLSTENPLVLTIDQDLLLTADFRRTYRAWELSQFTSAEREMEELTLPENDAFGSGFANLAIYAFGLDVRAPNRSSLPRLERDGENFAFIFHRLKDASDLSYTVEVSPDLRNWSALPPEEGTTEVIERAGSSTDIVRVTVVPDNPATACFVRLRILGGNRN